MKKIKPLLPKKTNMSTSSQLNDIFKKPTKEIKDYIPISMNQLNFRTNIQIKFPEESKEEYLQSFNPNIPFPEWPSEEEISNYNFGLNSNELFTDPNNNILIFPYSLRNETFNNFIWLRPKDIIKKQNLILNINKRLPFKNPTVVKNKIEKSDLNRNIMQRNSIDIAFAEGETSNLASNYINSKLTPIEKDIKEDNLEFNDEIYIINNNKIPSSIDMKRYYCKYSKWLGSIFQLIIDNNLNNKDFIKRIYPQDKNGFPIYNPSGKYWIKLYQMGKFRKIEIDDLILCNRNDYEIYFPQCEKINEIWPFLLTKALIKLFSYKYRIDLYDNEEIGDFSHLYALTSYTSVELKNIYIDNIEEKKEVFFEIFDDINYKEKNKIFVAYKISNDNDKKNELEKFSIIEEKKENNIPTIKKVYTHNIKNLTKSPIRKAMTIKKKNNNITFNFNNEKTKIKKISNISPFYINENENNNLVNPTLYYTGSNSLLPSQKIKVIKFNLKNENGIYYDIIYSILDFFQTGNFNMERLLPIPFSDLRLDITTKYKQLSRDERNEYYIQLNILKKKQQIEKKSRIKKFKEEGKNTFFFKLINNSIDKNDLKLSEIKTKFNSKQIEMAKYCILNNEKYPPIEYFEDTFIEKIWKDEDNGEVNFWTEKFYKKLIKEGKNKEDKKKENKIYPIERIKGSWIPYEEFKENFSNFSVLLDINKYKNTIKIDNLFFDDNNNNNSNNISNNNNLNNEKEYSSVIYLKEENDINEKLYNGFFLIFEPNCEKYKKSISSSLPLPKITNSKVNKFDDIILSLTLQIYSINKETKKISKIENDTYILKKLFSSYYINTLQKNCNYIIIIKGGIVPFGYTLQFFSNDYSFEKYSYPQFLIEFKNYSYKNFNILNPILLKDNFYVFTRLKITYPEILNKEVFFYSTFLNYENNNLRYFLDIFLINTLNKNKRLHEKQLFSINFNECQEYIVEISMTPPYNIPQNKFEFQLLYDDNKVKIEQLEIIHPFYIRELYIPNKRRLLFNEILFCSEYERITFVIEIEFEKKKNEIPNSEDSNLSNDYYNIDKSIINSNNIEENNEYENKSIIHNYNNYTEDIETLQKSKIKLIFEYWRGKNLLFKKEFYNKIIIRNLLFNGKLYPKEEGDLNQIIPTLNRLKCYIDTSECPKSILENSENKNNLYWKLTVFSSENIQLVKNTIKEDFEKAIKESWEILEPGRAIKAKKSRKKFFLQKFRANSHENIGKNEINLNFNISNNNDLSINNSLSNLKKNNKNISNKNNSKNKNNENNKNNKSKSNKSIISIKEDSNRNQSSNRNKKSNSNRKIKNNNSKRGNKKSNTKIINKTNNNSNNLIDNEIPKIPIIKPKLITRKLPKINSYTSIFMKEFYNSTKNKRLIILSKDKTKTFTNDTQILKTCYSQNSLNSTYKGPEEKKKEINNLIESYDNYNYMRKESIKKKEEIAKNYNINLQTNAIKFYNHRQKLKNEILEGDKKILDDFVVKNNKINQKYQNIKHILNKFTKNSSNIESKDFFDFYSILKESIDIKNIKKEYNVLIKKTILYMSKFENKLLKESIEKEDKEILNEIISHDKNDNILDIDLTLIERAKEIISQTKKSSKQNENE